MKRILSLILAMLMLLSVSASAVEVFPAEDSPTGYNVTFTYDDPDATRVRVYGEWNFIDPADSSISYANEDWVPGLLNYGGSYYELEKGEDGIWSVTVPIPNGLYGYRFYIGGECELTDVKDATVTWDPSNRPINNDTEMKEGQGGDYYLSTFYAPFDAEKQTVDYTVQAPRTDEYKGTIEFLELEASKYPLTLYLPYNYDVEREEPYKLFVLFHGGGGFYANWVNNGAAANIADNLIADGKFGDDTIILMPQLSLSDDVAGTLVDVIMPYLYENYNVSPNYEDHAFSGLSAGGMQTTRTIISHPDQFKYYHWMSGSGLVTSMTAKQVLDFQNLNLVLRFSCNPLDFAFASIDTDVKVLTALGYDITYSDLGTGHCWHTWRIHLADYLENYLWK